MSNNGEERTDLVILVDEEGNEHDFALIDRFQVETGEYAILVPVTHSESGDNGQATGLEEEEAFIFRIDKDEDDNEEFLVEVEDEIEWSTVAAVWEERLQSMDFDDEDDIF